MKKYWYGKTIDKNVSENDTKWENINTQLISLSFNNNGQHIHLPDHKEYIQGKTGSWTHGNDNSIIESRYIGFKDRNTILKIRIDESSNDIRIETIHAETSH